MRLEISGQLLGSVALIPCEEVLLPNLFLDHNARLFFRFEFRWRLSQWTAGDTQPFNKDDGQETVGEWKCLPDESKMLVTGPNVLDAHMQAHLLKIF